MIKTEIKSKQLDDICLLMQPDNHKWCYLCDCGDASLLTVKDCIKTNALFISHAHIDHFSNFDFVLRMQLGLKSTVTICGPRGIAKNVQGKLHGYLWNLIEEDAITYQVHEIIEQGEIEVYELKPPLWKLTKIGAKKGDVVFKNEAFTATYTILDHGTPSVAYLFQELPKAKIKTPPYPPGPWMSKLKTAFQVGNAEEILDVNGAEMKAGDLFEYLYWADGYSVAYVMDHLASAENHEKIINLVQGADKLYIESYYRDIDRDFALKNNHSTAKESGKVARLAAVKQLFLVHHSRRYNTEVTDLIEEGKAEFEGREPVFKEEPISRY